MKDIPESVINPHVLWISIEVHFSCLFSPLLALRIVHQRMSHSIIRSFESEFIIAALHIAVIKLNNVQRGALAASRRNGVPFPLKPFLILNVLLSCYSIKGSSRCSTTAARGPPPTSKGLLL
jgi:hypothetical protein